MKSTTKYQWRTERIEKENGCRRQIMGAHQQEMEGWKKKKMKKK